MDVQRNYKIAYVTFHMTSAWHHVVTVFLRPICHVVMKKPFR